MSTEEKVLRREISELTKELKESNNPEIYYKRGLRFHLLGENTKAVSDLEKVTQYDQKNFHLGSDIALYGIYFSNEEYDKALNIVNRAISKVNKHIIDPLQRYSYYFLYFWRSELFYEIGNYEDCFSDITTITKSSLVLKVEHIQIMKYMIISMGYSLDEIPYDWDISEKETLCK